MGGERSELTRGQGEPLGHPRHSRSSILQAGSPYHVQAPWLLGTSTTSHARADADGRDASLRGTIREVSPRQNPLTRALSYLAKAHPPLAASDPLAPIDPWERILWENAAYLVDDTRRAEVFGALASEVSLDPAAILAVPKERLAAVIARGGMLPTSAPRSSTRARASRRRSASTRCAARSTPAPRAPPGCSGVSPASASPAPTSSCCSRAASAASRPTRTRCACCCGSASEPRRRAINAATARRKRPPRRCFRRTRWRSSAPTSCCAVTVRRSAVGPDPAARSVR